MSRNLSFTSHTSKLMHKHLQLTLEKEKAYNIMVQIHSWMETNGPEWTVDRLKSLKTWFVQHLAGNSEYCEPWFKLARSSNGSKIPAGVFHSLFNDCLYSKHKHNKKIIKVLSALMVYTGIRLKKPSSKQILKTVGSIQGPMLDKTQVDLTKQDGSKLKNLLSKDQLNVVGRFKALKQKGFKFNPVSLNTGKPFVTGGEKYISSFLQGCHVPAVREYLRESFVDFPEIENFPKPRPEDFPPTKDNILQLPLSGQIVVIQEAGAKARVVANPSSSAQVALYPLAKVLDEMLRLQHSDCTHNQLAGAQWAQQKLAMGHTVYSVDLSGATDNFPISLQLALLSSLGLESEAKLIEAMARGIWMLHPDLHTDLIVGGLQIATTYTKGQPQGLYGSFPLFGLTHNLLVTALCSKLGIDVDDSFRILGDDIVLINEDLHRLYREYMSRVGVPISENKSLTSSCLAEFAGYIITPDQCYKPAKVPNPTTNKPYEHSFYNYLQVVGTEGIKYLPSKVRKIARKVAMLPEWLGGLGLNPQGLSYAERTESFLEKLNDKDEVPRYFSLRGNYSALQYRDIPEYQKPVMNWIYDQWILYENHVKSIVQSSPTLARMVDAGITEVHSLAYQLSALSGCPDGKALIGNKSPEEQTSKPYKTDFEIWRSRFVLDDWYKEQAPIEELTTLRDESATTQTDIVPKKSASLRRM